MVTGHSMELKNKYDPGVPSRMRDASSVGVAMDSCAGGNSRTSFADLMLVDGSKASMKRCRYHTLLASSPDCYNNSSLLQTFHLSYTAWVQEVIWGSHLGLVKWISELNYNLHASYDSQNTAEAHCCVQPERCTEGVPGVNFGFHGRIVSLMKANAKFCWRPTVTEQGSVLRGSG